MKEKIDDLLVTETETDNTEEQTDQPSEGVVSDEVLGNDQNFADLEKSEAPVENEQEESEETEESDKFEIPAKFKNKGLEDVVQSYIELEKEYGRRSQELGELRKLTDEIIKQQLVSAPASNSSESADTEEVDTDDILYEPEKVVNKLVETNPKLRQIEQELNAAKAQTAKQRLQEKHPDYGELVASPDFVNWVTESPVRQQLFIQADQQYDFNAADELFTWYKTTKMAEKEAAVEVRQKAAKSAAKKAATESSGGTANKPVFSRQELIKLRIENPRRFQELESVIMDAYADGRVR